MKKPKIDSIMDEEAFSVLRKNCTNLFEHACVTMEEWIGNHLSHIMVIATIILAMYASATHQMAVLVLTLVSWVVHFWYLGATRLNNYTGRVFAALNAAYSSDKSVSKGDQHFAFAIIVPLHLMRLYFCEQNYWFSLVFAIYLVSVMPAKKFDVESLALVKYSITLGSFLIIWLVHNSLPGAIMAVILLLVYSTIFKSISVSLFFKCRQLEMLSKKLQQKNETKLMFMSNVAHEFKSPLQSIKGSIELMQSDKHVTESQQEYLHTIDCCTDLMLGFIQELLDYAKLGQQTPDSVSSPCICVHECITRACSVLKGTLDLKQVSLKLDIDKQVPIHAQCMAEIRLEQILINLMSNAIKASPKNSAISVHASMSKESELTVSIADKGCGITPEKAQSLFTPFFGEGTGLGLSICRRLAKHAGGDITFQSDSNGTTFHVVLPCFAQEKDCGKCTMHESYRVAISGARMSCSVLDADEIIIADDSHWVRKLLQEVLQKQGYQTVAVSSGEDVLKLFEMKKYPIVITDYRMPPGMNGVELANTLKSTHNPKVILLTGGEEPTESHCTVDKVLFKPVNCSTLCKVVEELLATIK